MLNIFVLLGKKSFSNKKSTSQKATHKKIHTTHYDLYRDVFLKSDRLEILI
jgi:hypothetical protein